MTLTRLATSLVTLAAVALLTGGCAGLIDRRADQRQAAAELEYPPQGQFVAVNGTRVHAVVQGSGPDLILIHGASGSTRDFTFDLMARLSPRYRVIAFDRPGLGYTDSLGDAGLGLTNQANLLRAAAAQLGVRHPIILGQSYGGAVALAWALADPGGPRALVLVSAPSLPWPGNLGAWYPIASSKLGGATIVPLLAAFAPLGRASDVISAIFAPQAAPKGYADHIGAGLTIRRETIRMNARQVNALKGELTALAPRYPGLTLPVELIHGTADTIVSPTIHSQPLAQILPGARLTLLPGVGHMAHHADPQAVTDAIDRAAARAGLR